MSEPRIDKRRHGWALVDDTRLAPFGYVREGKLKMKFGSDELELSPDNLRWLADEIEALEATRVFRLTAVGATTISRV